MVAGGAAGAAGLLVSGQNISSCSHNRVQINKQLFFQGRLDNPNSCHLSSNAESMHLWSIPGTYSRLSCRLGHSSMALHLHYPFPKHPMRSAGSGQPGVAWLPGNLQHTAPPC